MVQLHYSRDDYGIDTSDRIGSFYHVKLNHPAPRPRQERSQSVRERASLVTKGQLEKKVTSKDDCCDVCFSHPLLTSADIL